MESRALWIAFFITIQFSAVLGKNPFYEYFYNKYHHKDHHSSTTEEISSVSGDFEIIEHLSADNDDTSMTPPTLQYGNYHNTDPQTVFVATWITIFCVICLSLFCGCICFCIRQSRGSGMIRGRVVTMDRPETTTQVPSEQPELAQQRVFAQQQLQPLVIPQYLQPVTTQHHQQQQFFGGHKEDPPPYYQSLPGQQQQHPPTLSSQTSPTQDHSQNPPESPPPAYDFPEKFE